MTRVTQTVYSKGIHHGLPTFPSHDGKKYTAIVTGANGISGSEIVNALAASPERWETIYALSRRPAASVYPQVKNIATDFLESSPEELAKLFKKEGIKADYVFFTSYMQPHPEPGAGIWSNASELEKINVTLLSNFLDALSISNIIPKRILLQTGSKHYALHLGPTSIPMTEDTPALRIKHDNFYFPQEDLLSSWAAKHSTSWIVSRPGFILGANPSAPINITYALAIYAAVQKGLGGELDFPADIQAWDINKDLSTASLIGFFSEWAVLTPEARNETFNIGKFWPELADWYGLRYSTPEIDDSKYTIVTLPRDPPPRGFGKPGEVKIAFSFEAWAQKPEVQAAWKKLQEKDRLKKEFDPWRDAGVLKNVFATLDAEMLGGWARTQTMDKAKKLGWHGHVQTNEGLKATLDKMIEMRMVPRI